MSSPLSPDFLKDVVEMATEKCLSLADYIVGELVVDGLTFGDESVDSPDQFVLFYEDLRQRHVLDHLEVIAPQLAARMRRKYASSVTTALGLRS